MFNRARSTLDMLVPLAEVLGERVSIRIYFFTDHQCVPCGLVVTIWAGVSKVPSSIPVRTFFPPSLLPYLAASPRPIYVPYYRKLTLHEIKVLEINAT